MPNPPNRKLAAILFADIEGYTAIMQRGEGRALSILQRFTTVMQEEVTRCRGQIVKTYGDGSLLLFESAVEAVQCALAMQQAFRQEPQVPLRIGIHVGEVVQREQDIFGDAVNIASRIEGLGIPGSVLLSRNAWEKIYNQENLPTRSLGRFALKNVAEPVQVFALTAPGLPVPPKQPRWRRGKTRASGSRWSRLGLLMVAAAVVLTLLLFWPGQDWREQQGPAPGEISIGIVPFRNIGGSAENAPYGFGMASEIRTRLSLSKQFSHISSLQATARYANTDLSPQAIGQELGVDYLLLGLYQIAGDEIRVNVELINAATGENVEELPPYQGPFQDVFQLQAEIANRVLRQFAFFRETGPTTTGFQPDLLAYGNYLRGQELLWDVSISGERFRAALHQFETAIARDSAYLSAWVGLVRAASSILWHYGQEDSQYREKATAAIAYLEEHFPDSWEKKFAQGVYAYYGENRLEAARQYLLEVIKENPENVEANSHLSFINKRLFRMEEALFYIAKALQQDPQNNVYWTDVLIQELIQGNDPGVQEILSLWQSVVGDPPVNWVLYHHALRTADTTLILADWKQELGPCYQFLRFYGNRNWSACLSLLDTVDQWPQLSPFTREYAIWGWKARIFHLAGRADSSRYYAQRVLNAYAEDPTIIQTLLEREAFTLTGQAEKALAPIPLIRYNSGGDEYVERRGERLEQPLSQVDMKLLHIRHQVMLNQYSAATESLKKINEQFPNWGDYREFHHDPVYDRIKQEYPPFQEALDNLLLPPVAPFPVKLKG